MKIHQILLHPCQYWQPPPKGRVMVIIQPDGLSVTNITKVTLITSVIVGPSYYKNNR